MKKPATIKRLISSGGVIFRHSGNGTEVALVAVKGGTVWCLPKGLIDENEDAETTALREVEEETGLKGNLLGEIGLISYWYFVKDENAKVHKTVHFYLMEYIDGHTDMHDSEVDDARWFPVKEAFGRLTYNAEKGILQKAEKMIEGIDRK